MEYLFLGILWIAVVYCDFHMVKSSSRQDDPFKIPFNGIGALPWVMTGASLAPMQYRVLVPWLTYLIGKVFGPGRTKYAYFEIYIRVRWAAIAAALCSAHWYFGMVTPDALFATTILAVFFCVAALYDYTDGHLEVAFFALAFGLLTVGVTSLGGVLVMMALALVASLNRETSVFIPIVAALFGNVFLFAAATGGFVAGYIIPRAMYGNKRRYCKPYINNFKFWKMSVVEEDTPFPYNQYTHFGLIAVTWVVLAVMSWPLDRVEIGMGLMFVALLVPTMWREIRVFGPTLLALIPMGMNVCR